MKTRVLLAKYIRDPRRWEPMNIGVIVVRGEEARAHFVGERDGGSIDARTTRHIVGDTEVFAEWVRYWRSALERGEDGANELLERTTQNYWVADQGELWLNGDDSGLEELARRYFGELVSRADDESDATVPHLKERVEAVLLQAEISEAAHSFQRDAIVTASGLEPPERYKFHYRAENGHVTIGQRVSLEPVFIHDVMWKFEHLPDDYRRVAFVVGEEASEDLGPTLVHLKARSRVIDVFAPAAVDEVREVFVGD
jgi:hypothetical protein